MAEDYLTDDEQLEQVKRVIAENWAWVAGGIVLGAALIFGYRYYEDGRNARALRAAAQFDVMSGALERNDVAAARGAAGGLIRDYPASPYADQAQLLLARLAVDEGKLADAVGPLTLVADDSKDTELRHIARLRLARVLIDQGTPDDALKTLANDASGAFAADAHEVRGDAFYAKKDLRSALTEYKAALDAGAGGGADAALLQLKIADLGVPPAPATAMIPTAPASVAPVGPSSAPTAPSTKAKP
jgi:predicted negative regulator of RcsB-dependent stress response